MNSKHTVKPEFVANKSQQPRLAEIGSRKLLWACVSLMILALLALPITANAQTGGEGAISGHVSDSTGAAIPDATVTATNTATNVSTTRTSSGAGDYVISPILPGVYTVKVAAKGFKTLVQSNIVVDALAVKGFNPTLTIGDTATTVTVTEAPPSLDTTNATIGLTVENGTYADLPNVLPSNGQTQRDPTAFGNLAPGAASGARLPIVGGAGNYLGQLYLDGLPAETINQQGDNRVVSLTMNVDAVDQFQIVTSTPPAEYSGAGSENFTMKSGGLKYHGSAADFIRNTALDAWCFTCKWVQVSNAAGVKSYQNKPSDHQNELSLSVGGKAPHTGEKLFFFFSYDKFHSRVPGTPTQLTIPTTLMRTGDFTELNTVPQVAGSGLTGIAGNPAGGSGTATLSSTTTCAPGTSPCLNPAFLYDPMSTVCGATCTRTPFQGLKNGVPTYNVIPTSDLSTITLAMAKYLPAPSNAASLTNNYLGYIPKGWDNYVFNTRIDYDLNSRNRISGLLAKGKQQYLNNFSAPLLPIPYVGGTFATITPQVYDVEDAFVINNNMTNQLKYGFVRFSQPQVNASYGITQYLPATFGITNLPEGDASLQFPGVSFAQAGAFTTVAEQTWTANSTASSYQKVVPNNFALVDNFLWTKGRHALTLGISMQWQQGTLAAPVGYSGILSLPTTQFATANYTASSTSLNSNTGFSYASYLLGAIGGSPTIALQPVSETSGRYHPVAPYVDDSFKVNNKLTLDLGLRWDYLPSFHEVKDRWTFLNPTMNNPLTSTAGLLQFAGNYGGPNVSCGCRTPVQTYWKNFGPRVGLIYSLDEKTVLRAGVGIVFSQGGGTGGRGGYATGTGQTGFNMTAIGNAETTSGSTPATPSFWLGTQSYLGANANAAMFGPTFTGYPAAPTPNLAAQELNTGFYVDSSSVFHTAASVGYADPYFSDRAPEMVVYNFGLERSLTKDLTISLNYVGNQSHFILNSTNSGTGTARGYWSNQLNPIYLAALGSVSDSTNKGPILNAPANPANVLKAQAALPGLNIPAFFQTAAQNAKGTSATIAQGLTAFPQYSGVSDTYGSYTGNFNYNSFQLMIQQRLAHGLTFNINYTYSKNVGDDGPFRTGFNIPAAAISGGGHDWHMNRIDRSYSAINQPQTINVFGVYQLPGGHTDSLWRRELLGGWKVSGIYTYRSGFPALVTWGGTCTTANGSTATSPLQGQCMPDLAGLSTARTNGSYGTGPNGTTACNLGIAAIGGACKQVQYFDVNAFKTPTNVSPIGAAQYLIGNAPRTHALNMNNPGSQNLDAAVKRSFSLSHEMAFTFEADCANVWNKVTFSAPSGAWTPGSTTFGGIGSIANTPRNWQFAGRFSF